MAQPATRARTSRGGDGSANGEATQMPERGAPQWEGSRRPEPGTKRTMQDIFQKLDKLVTPGVGQASTSSQTADALGSRKWKRGSKGTPCETLLLLRAARPGREV